MCVSVCVMGGGGRGYVTSHMCPQTCDVLQGITIITCKHVLRVKLLSVNSTFAANYQYLSFKFGLTEADWYTSLNHLLGKVKKKIALLHPQPVLCGVLKELCVIRDNTYIFM